MAKCDVEDIIIMRIIKYVPLVLILWTITAVGKQPPITKNVRISWDKSTYLEMTSVNVPYANFVEENLYYPRIKRLSNGSLLMTFENDHFGWDIYSRRSFDNGKSWSDANLILRRTKSHSSIGEDEIVYVNPDFIELADGRIMLACQWRYKNGYNDLSNTNNNCGIVIMFSHDFGASFSEPVEIYRGRCWEPSMIQLPTGEIQMFFTSSQELIDNMSAPQTVIIRSFDGGNTWQGKKKCGIFDNEVISRTIDGRSSYDGMPTGVLLNNNGGIAVAVEVWHGKWVTDQTPVVVKTDNVTNWHREVDSIRLKGGPAWPNKKQVNKDFYGYGPYCTKLPTGEMIILSNGTYKGNEGVWTFIGDEKADNFSNASSPFNGYWGSIDYIGNNKVIATATEKYLNGGSTRGKVKCIIGHLNYSKEITKSNLPLIPISKFNRDNNDCWFLGHSFQSSLFADFGYTDENFIFVSYIYDKKLTALTTENADASELLLARGKGPQYKIVVNGLGNYVIYQEDHLSWKLIFKGETTDKEVSGTLNQDNDEDIAFSAKLKIPWKLLGGKPKKNEVLKAHLRHHYKNLTQEKPAWQIEDEEGEDSDYPQEWLNIYLK